MSATAATETAYERIVKALETHGSTVQTRGDKTSAQCPAHEDHAPSLSVTGIEGQTLVHCHAGCETVDVLAVLGVTMADLYDTRRGVDYAYDNGRVVHRKVDKRGGFPQSNTDRPVELYRLSRVRAAVAEGRPVFVAEGEKDVHALEAVGVTATTAPMGAGKWSRVDPSPLYGGKVLVIVDQDERGRAHAADVLASLAGKADAAAFAPKVGKDAADHIAAGHGVGEFVPQEVSAEPTPDPERPPGVVPGRAAVRPRPGGGGVSEAFDWDKSPLFVGPDAGAALLDELTEWFGRFIFTVGPEDCRLLAIWTVHTHVVSEVYTTPRLQIDSPMPGSGKTTVLEHLQRLCLDPVTLATVSSSALLARLLAANMRTLLIDEADRSLNLDNDGVRDVFAILNTGYKRGASRPVLVPVKGGAWEAEEMSTFAPVVMAGNNPNLPDDTRTRLLRVLLLPDLEGQAEESDWELIENDALNLRARIEQWADQIRDDLRTCRPPLPDGITGRFREKWSPLRRVAELAGGDWPHRIDSMALADKEQYQMDKEDGLVRDRPAVLLLHHLLAVWPEEAVFMPTSSLLEMLISRYPDAWGVASPYGKPLTAQRFGRMLATAYKLNSTRQANDGPRGYTRAALDQIWRRMRLLPLSGTAETGSTGSTGHPGAGSAGSTGSPGPRETPPAPTDDHQTEPPAPADFYAAFHDDTADTLEACPECGAPTRPYRGARTLCLACSEREYAETKVGRPMTRPAHRTEAAS